MCIIIRRNNIQKGVMYMNRKILIIDDDRDLCDLLCESIRKEKIVSDVRYNGTDGLVALERSEYQLVVLDVMMPGIVDLRCWREYE